MLKGNGDIKRVNLIANRKINNLYQVVFFISSILFLLVWISFIFTPWTNDIKVFMASANQSNYISSNLIIGSFKAWELKSVFSRMLTYLIYKISCVFVTYNSVAFEAMSKFIYSLFIISGSYISMRLLFRQKKVILNTIIVSLSFMALHAKCQMEVEMSSSMLILLAFSLYLNAIKYRKNQISKLIISGMLIGSVFFFKSVLILLSVTVVAAVGIYEIDNKIEFSIKRLMLVVLGSLITLFLTTIAIIFINPSEFQDMLDASRFQSTLFSASISIKEIIRKFGYYHMSRIKYIPVVVVGIICFILNICENIHRKKWDSLFLHFVMWSMPALFIMLSNQYFVYHFVAYIFPSLIEIYYVILYQNKYKTTLLLVLIISIVFWYVTVLSIISNHVRTYMECNKKAYKETADFLNQVSYNKNETVLYLDDGCGGYCLGGPSYLKYFFPLPLQRLDENSDLKCHKYSLKMAMEFEGRYISVYEKWFFKEGKYAGIKDKIMNEYEYLGSYYVFVPPLSVDASEIIVKTYDLYERK